MSSSRTPSQKGKLSRRKGASGEREIAVMLRGIYPEARRGIGQARSAGEVPDVDGTPYWIEIKCRKRLNITAALEQAITDSGGRRPPLAITRADGKLALVTMRIADWLALVAAAQAAGIDGAGAGVPCSPSCAPSPKP